jgi:hypothetical protein
MDMETEQKKYSVENIHTLAPIWDKRIKHSGNNGFARAKE